MAYLFLIIVAFLILSIMSYEEDGVIRRCRWCKEVIAKYSDYCTLCERNIDPADQIYGKR